MSLEDRLRRTLREADDLHPPDDFVRRTMDAIGPRRPSRAGRLAAGFAVIAVVAVVSLSGLLLSPKTSTPGGPSSAPGLPGGAPTGTPPPAGASPTPASSGSPVAPGPTSSHAPVIATSPPGSGGGDALGEGTLGGTVRDGAACFWLISSGSRPPGYRAALVWPYGFRARTEPLRIVGPDGQDLARVGDEVALGGGGPPVGYEPTASQDPCGLGAIFFVSEVVSVNGTPSGVGEGSLRLVTRAAGDPASCPSEPLEPLMLVMSGGHLRLRLVASGQDVDATWPDGFSARAGNRIAILDGGGAATMTQGIERADVLGARSPDGTIAVCGVGATVYP